MGRFLLLILAATSVAQADSFTSASCTYGSTTQAQTQTGTNANPVSCFVQVFAANAPIGGVQANAQTFTSVSGTQAFVEGGAKAVEEFDVQQYSQYLTADFSAIATADNSQNFATPGSKRAGFIRFTIQTDTGNGSEFISDGVHQYSFQQSNGIQQSIGPTTLPFDLGSPFQVSVSADAGVGPPPQKEFINGADANVSFSLLEANGTTAVPLFITPEPSTWTLLLLGLCGAWFTLSRRAPKPTV